MIENRCKHLLFTYDPNEMDLPPETYITSNINIQRPKTPFPGQTMSNQMHVHEFDNFVSETCEKLLLNKYANEELRQTMYKLIEPEFPNGEKLNDILHEHMSNNMFLSNDVLNFMRLDLIKNAYSHSPIVDEHRPFHVMLNHCRASKSTAVINMNGNFQFTNITQK